MGRRLIAVAVLAAVLGLSAFWVITAPAAVPDSTLAPHTPDLANGKVMFLVGGCSSCHATPGQDDKTKLGGGFGLKSPFGIFYAPNISPDPNDGIGRWSEADFVTAMLNIDLTAVGSWAERNNVAYASYQELAGHPLVYAMIAEHVAEVNRSLAAESIMAGAQIKRFLILHKELDPDDGELTRTQKVRRGFIAERYEPLIRALYDGSTEADISTQVTFEDGRKGVISARVKIRDMVLEPVQTALGKAA